MSPRTRLFVRLTLSMLLIIGLASITTAALAIWRARDPQPTTEAGTARVGDNLAVLVIAQRGDDSAAHARHDALHWMFTVLGLTMLPTVALGWFASGRVLRTVDDAIAEVDATGAANEQERRRRLDEVIHELRTPLAVAGTNLELAASDPTIDPETARLIDAARRAADRMRRTVDDLAEHGRLAVTRGDVLDLAAEARAVVAEHAGPARARGLHLRATGTSELGLPAGDHAAVRTALGNLISNAIRLAPSGSAIVVAYGQHGAWAWVAVIDEGPGMPDRLHERAFERGWRGRHDRDHDRSTEPAQRGLGLTITRQLTEAQGGLITLESEEGAGSAFTIWLPLADDAIEADVVVADRLHPAVRPWREMATVRSS